MRTTLTMRPGTGLGFIILIISLLFLVEVFAGGRVARSGRGPAVIAGAEGQAICIAEADRLIANYRLTTEPGNIHGELFGHEAVWRILDQQGCAGLRIYYARRDDLTPVLVLMGVDRYGADLRSGVVVEHGVLCPPICDTPRVFVP